MLTNNTHNAEKLAGLKQLSRLQLCEVAAVYLPEGVRYFGTAAFHELPNFRGINRDGAPITVEARLIGSGREFPEVQLSADVADESVSLNFDDSDGEILALLGDAEGSKVELFYYLPELDWLVSHWWGHLQLPDAVDLFNYRAAAECGTRSSQMSIPRTNFQQPCQNIFGGAHTTQAAIDGGRCPYNRQIEGGTVGSLDGGEPFTTCPKTKAACIERLGDTLSFTGFDTEVINIVIGQSNGPATQAVSRGNETNLSRPLRRHYGARVVRDLDLGAMRPEANSNHPDQGFLAALFWIGVGRYRSISACSIINMMVGAEHLNTRLGGLRQPATVYAPNVLNYSGIAHMFGRVGPLNPGGYNPGNVFGQCTVEGADDVRVYTGQDAFTLEYSTNPAWCFLDLYRDPFFGHGVDPSIFVMQDWIELAEWCDEFVSYTDPFGAEWVAQRNVFNADVQGRTAQAQFEDICLWHRFMPPFQYLGKLRTFPLRPLTEEELEAAPAFYDDTPERNILRGDNRPLLTWSRTSDRNLPNQLAVTFEETNAGLGIANVERPLTFGDEQQQLRAGRAFGDTTVRIVPQSYQAFGITNLAEVVRKANQLLDTGERDQGGLKNNFRVEFVSDFQHGFELYPGQVIRLESSFIAGATANLQAGGFKYFRVVAKARRSDASFQVTAQAYPEVYWATAEEVVPGGGGPTSFDHEAEDAVLEGGATAAEDASCSGGQKVIDVGLGGQITFTELPVSPSGFATVTVYYKCDDLMRLRIRANAGAALLMSCPGTGDQVGSRTVVLGGFGKSSENTVTIFHLTENCPDIDKIRLMPIEDSGGGGPCRPGFGEVTYSEGRIEVPIEPC